MPFQSEPRAEVDRIPVREETVVVRTLEIVVPIDRIDQRDNSVLLACIASLPGDLVLNGQTGKSVDL
jgi:hypothetical protein